MTVAEHLDKTRQEWEESGFWERVSVRSDLTPDAPVPYAYEGVVLVAIVGDKPVRFVDLHFTGADNLRESYVAPSHTIRKCVEEKVRNWRNILGRVCLFTELTQEVP